MKAFLAKLFSCRCALPVVVAKDHARVRPPGPQTLGPNQLAWLDEKFRFYGVFRAQASAQTGVAAIQPPRIET
jgi:hypothetical protein